MSRPPVGYSRQFLPIDTLLYITIFSQEFKTRMAPHLNRCEGKMQRKRDRGASSNQGELQAVNNYILQVTSDNYSKIHIILFCNKNVYAVQKAIFIIRFV